LHQWYRENPTVLASIAPTPHGIDAIVLDRRIS
jgi:hypothetical protein